MPGWLIVPIYMAGMVLFVSTIGLSEGMTKLIPTLAAVAGLLMATFGWAVIILNRLLEVVNRDVIAEDLLGALDVVPSRWSGGAIRDPAMLAKAGRRLAESFASFQRDRCAGRALQHLDPAIRLAKDSSRLADYPASARGVPPR
jgi:hypothetical protein